MTFFDALLNSGILYAQDVNTSAISTIKAGGCAEYVLYPEGDDELIRAYKLCREYGKVPLLIGNMSNTLISDSGYRGALISTCRMNRATYSEGCIYAPSGVMLPRLIKECAVRGIRISPELSGVPTTVGGAVRGNAGAYGVSVSDIVSAIRIYSPKEDKTAILTLKEAEFGYRTSIFKKEPLIILGASLIFKCGVPENILKEISGIRGMRRKSQPTEPSLGSFFKNPQSSVSASYLIDTAGLKGRRVGGAEVSQKHAGFIINRTGASAEDIASLASLVRNEVFRKFGIMLEYEAELIGEFLKTEKT